MKPHIAVHMLPQFLESAELSGSTAVMIDVLRASTTIVHALANNASLVIPCETIEQAQDLKASQSNSGHSGNGEILLGGERGGERIAGFDLGNSPVEYSPEAVAGKTIIFTTTNGTKALEYCRGAARVLIGAFVNQSALVRVLQQEGRPVHLVCAGTDGQLTAEDILFAGTVAAQLNSGDGDTAAPVTAPPLDVQTQMSIDFAVGRSADEETFRETIRSSRGGQNLLRLGLDADVDRAGCRDLFDVVPEWIPQENRIVPAILT